jgi:hypothetical protein
MDVLKEGSLSNHIMNLTSEGAKDDWQELLYA